MRVRVPLRSAGRVVDGYIVEVGEPDASDRPLSELDAVVSPVPVLTPGLYALARRAADRAAGSASDILRLAIPKRMVRAEKAWLAARPPAERPSVDADARAWAEAALGGFPGLGEAIARGERLAVDAPPRDRRGCRTGREVGAWAVLLAAAAVRTLAAGRIARSSSCPTTATGAARGRTGRARRPPTPSSATTPGRPRRCATPRSCARSSPAPCIVIGNRSAVYAPVHELGLIAIWDDGDPLLAEPLSPGVHARDAALLRQELDGGALVFAGHTRTTDVERLVAVGWVREVPAARRASPRVVLSATREGESRGARVPSAAFAAAREALADRPGARAGRPARLRPGAGLRRVPASRPLPALRRAAARRAPGRGARVRLVRPRGARLDVPRLLVDPRAHGVVGQRAHRRRARPRLPRHPRHRRRRRRTRSPTSTPARRSSSRPAAPSRSPTGGYRAVILLDGDRMLLADDLRIGESCLRWWSNAAALAAPGAPVHLVGVAGPVARALATWTQAAYARAELADRAPLRMPPTVRVAALEGDRRAVDGRARRAARGGARARRRTRCSARSTATSAVARARALRLRARRAA